MIKLKKLLTELDLQKDKFQSADRQDRKEFQSTLFDLISNAYAPIGGHHDFRQPSDIMADDLDFWVVADVDSDPEIDIVYFGKQTPFGIKHTGLGHDGEKSNIKKLLQQKTKELSMPGHYVEVSGKAFESFAKRGGIPTVNDEQKVRAVLKGKDIIWHGDDPKGEYEHKGWYSRKIGGKLITKIMIGQPK